LNSWCPEQTYETCGQLKRKVFRKSPYILEFIVLEAVSVNDKYDT